MSNDYSKLPSGFVLDELPDGFVLDSEQESDQLPEGFSLDELPNGFTIDEPAQPEAIQSEVISQQEAIAPKAQEPSMLDMVGSKLSELAADPVPNAFKGAIERAGDVGAGALTSVNVAAKAGEKALGLGGLVWDGGVLPSYKGPEEYQAYLQQGGKDILAESEEGAKGLDAGYVPTHTWEEVKREFSEGGALSGSAWGEVVGYIGEQGVKSLPDMAAVLLNLPAYIVARSGEIGEARAQNKGKEQADLVDVVEAAPFAVGSALLERLGAKGITEAGAEAFGKEALKAGFANAAKRTAVAGGKAGITEAGTEAIQEGMIEYAGERFGTNAKMTLAESLDLAAAGAVAGGGMGGAAGTVSAGYKEATYSAEAELGKALGDFIDQSRLEIDQKAIAGQFDPSNAQLEVKQEPKIIAEPKAEKPLEVTGEFEGVQPQGEFTQGIPESTPAVYDIPEAPKNTKQIAEEKAEPVQKGKVKGLAVVEAPIDEVTLSSDVPQFKEGANASGVVEPLGGKFERTGVAPIQIWVREDGRKEVISGRHRLDLAKRSGEQTIPAQYHYESEGFTVEQAASLDAILNIREGQGKVKDYVEFIRATKPTEAEAAAQGILARQTGKRAFTIADSGSDTLIASHRANQISDEAATRIARAAPKNDALQSVGIKAIQDGKTIIMAENLVKAVGSMTTDKQQASEDLFGFDDSAMKEAVELAKKVGRKQAEIQRTLTAVTGAAKNPELARKEGVDVKDPEGIKKKIKQLKSKKKAWDNWHTSPKLMEQLKGKKPTTSKTETVAEPETKVETPQKPEFKQSQDVKGEKTFYRKGRREGRWWSDDPEYTAIYKDGDKRGDQEQKIDLDQVRIFDWPTNESLVPELQAITESDKEFDKWLTDRGYDGVLIKGEGEANIYRLASSMDSILKKHGISKPEFDLDQQTEADIKAAEEKQAIAKQEEKAAADKVEADKQVDDFVLAGSDSATDQAEARGQSNLFDTPAEPKKPAKKEAAKIDYATNAVEGFNQFRERTGKAELSKEDIQSSFDGLVENKEAVLAQLKKLTKAQLLKYVGRNDLKKPAMVDSAYKTMLSAHVFGDMVMTIFGGSKTYEEQIAEKVANQTQEQIETDYERQRQARADREKMAESFVKAQTNPETLAEYKEFIRVQGKSKLSAEQLKAYDTLVADSMLEEDKAKPKTVQGESEAVETTRAETTHAKKGHQLYVVSLVNRVSKEQYKELNDKAKEFGGYYSAYNKAGAIPGFQFKTIEEADQFEQVLKGKDIDKSDFEEAKADVKHSKQADKLIEMADKLEAKGNESLGQDRQTNTGKRAAQAASASEKAYKQIALAQTVKQIATKLAAGEIVYLGKMTQITQLEELKSIQRRAVPSSMMHSEYDGYSISNSIKEGVTVEDYINNVRMPELFIGRENAQRFSDKLDGVKGFSRFAAELKKLPMAEGKVHLGRLTKDQVKKLHDAVKAGHLSSYELGFIPDREKTMNRLDKLGIKTDEQLRTAIRELDSLTVAEQKEDPIKKLERDLVGKKIDGYFPTPRELVEQMIDYAEIQPGHQVLEPSAGKGNIADIIKESEPNAEIDVIEINQGLRSMLEVKGYNVVSNDFTDYDGKQYDRIIMNPPFENFQDIDHVKHAFELLKPGGKLVAIMGAGVKNSRKKAVEFRQWIDVAGSYIEDLPEGSFKSSERQTGVATVMVVLDKPDANTMNRREDTEVKAKVITTSEFSANIKKQFPTVKFGFTGRAGTIAVEKVIVPESAREKGVGTEAMKAIIELAGKNDLIVTLTPSADFGGNKARLVKFYKSLGFVENKGKNKSYEISDTMYLEPAQDGKLSAKQPEIVHAPGNNYVGLYRSTGIPSRKEVITIEGRRIKMPVEPQRIEPIMRQLVKIMGRRIYNGKIKGKSVQGFYRSDVGELRTARKNDVEILAHEMAHYLDLHSNVSLPNFKKLYKQAAYKDEVAALSYTDDKKLELLEGFAEFVRLWLTNSNEAQLRAPNFYDAFVKELARDRKLLNPMRDMQEAMHKFYFQGSDKLGQALIGRDEGVYGKFMDWTYRRDSLIRQETIDKFHAAREVEKELTGKLSDSVEGSAWKQFRIANGGYEGIAEYIMNYGTLGYAENGDLVRNGKSLYEILKPADTLKGKLKPEHKKDKPIDLLMRYFAGRRALELHRQGRENLIPKETAKTWAKMGTTYPVFEEIFTEYQEFNTRMMDMYEQAGLLTPEARQTMEKVNKDYVPFNRLRDSLEDGKGGGGFQRLKGGTANLEDILHNIQDGVTSNVKAALDSRAKQRLYQYIAGHRDGAIWATKIAPDSKLVKTHLADMEKKIGEVLEASGVVIEGELDLSDPGLLNFWQHGVKPTLTESGNFVDTVLVNGKPQYFEVQDPLLQEMLLTMNGESYSSLMNGMFAVKNFFTRSITLGVEFTGANLVRDTIGATFISKNQFRPFIDSFKGMYSYLTKDEHFQDFMRSGGGYSSRLHGSTKAGKARQRVQIKDVGVGNRGQRMLSAFDNLMSAFEYGTRIGEFRLAKKNGASDMDAAFAAREISTDFSVYGANHFLTGYIRTVPFLNAMIQSQDRVFREAFIFKKYGGNPTGLAVKAFLGLTVPTLLLWLLNKDDEDYKEIPDHEKRTNWHVPLGNGRFMKVPRPYDVGFVYATMPELFFQYLEDENGKEYAEGMTWTLLQMYGIDGVPAAAQGWWDITRNEKWTGAPVVPNALADVSATQQYNANTSETFIRLGQALNMSPIKAEHAFKAQTGYLGGYLLWGAEKLMWDEDKFGEMPDKDISSNIFIKRFLTPETRPNNRSMEKFFDLKEESDRVTADFKAGIDIRRMIKGDAQKEFEKDDTFFGLSKGEKEVLFALNDSMNDLISIAYGKEGIKTQEHSIRYNPKLTAEQKRESLDTLWQQRNEMFTQYYNEATKALDKAKKVAKKTGIEGSQNELMKNKEGK